MGGSGLLADRASGDWLSDLKGLAETEDRGGLGDCWEAGSTDCPALEDLIDSGVRGGLGDVGQTGGFGDKGECGGFGDKGEWGGLGDGGDRRSGE